MSSATLLDFPPPKPSARDLMVRALDPHVLIGMPHLSGCGLSETWLMKELGHRHWLMLALHLGMDNADFRTADGEEAYAAICASSLTAARFSDVQANDILTIRSVLSTVSRTQTLTRHEMSVHGRSIGACELVSTFVRRMVRGDNHSITRVALREPQSTRFEPSFLARAAADARNGRLEEHFGFPVMTDKALRECRFEPSLSQDFNGAGLLYFAEFQALADRAFERWFPDRRSLVHRDVFFLGNIQPNESVVFDLLALSDDSLSAQGQLRREDGYVIAKIFCRWAL
ncbi:Pnap_2097 family protein [Rhizobium herbae]|uniref:Biosynthetic protein (TIGR04099 family) n=1 Tax=Rhizobium herbae TaxID=508661 RepID=A0ABS4ERE6_9HYPH|nr:Pnap_2097 family protein [Rhizobium herbae]MBP1860519.1 putative biosynthetic protein (TIGR04099 family) [Rhizobium herbae]